MGSHATYIVINKKSGKYRYLPDKTHPTPCSKQKPPTITSVGTPSARIATFLLAGCLGFTNYAPFGVSLVQYKDKK